MSNEISDPFSSFKITPEVPSISVAVPELTQDEFINKSAQILNEGVQNYYSKEYVTDQILKLSRENSQTVSDLGFPADYQTIRQKVVEPYYQAAGVDEQKRGEEAVLERRSPQPTGGEGIRMISLPNGRGPIWVNERNEVVPWEDGSGRTEMLQGEFEKQAAKAYGTVVAAVVAGPAVRGIKMVAQAAWRVAQSTWSWAVGTAVTNPEVIKNTVECVENLIDQSPPPSTSKGLQCYVAKKVYTELKEKTTD